MSRDLEVDTNVSYEVSTVSPRTRLIFPDEHALCGLGQSLLYVPTSPPFTVFLVSFTFSFVFASSSSSRKELSWCNQVDWKRKLRRYLRDISEFDSARVTTCHTEMFHDESWSGNPFMLGSKDQRSRSRVTKTLRACVFTLVSASFV